MNIMPSIPRAIHNFQTDLLANNTFAQMNEQARIQNETIAGTYSVENSKNQYQLVEVLSLNKYLSYLLWFYFILGVLFLGLLFRSKSSMTTKILCAAGVGVFPFVVTPVELYIYGWYVYLGRIS